MKENIIKIEIPYKEENKCILFNSEINKNKIINIKEIENKIKKDKNSSEKEVVFTGESFSNISLEIQEKILSKMCELYKENKIKGIKILTEPKNIDKKILKIYKKYKVTTIGLRIYSTNDYILNKIGVDFDFDDIKRISKLIRRKFIRLSFEIMIGLPESTKFDEINVAKQIIKLKPKEVDIYPSLIIKGTKLAIMEAKNEYDPLTIVQAVDRCKELIYMFTNKNIKVFEGNYDRFFEKLVNEDEIRGPYNKEFNKLVESSIWYDTIVNKIKKFNVKVKEVEINANPDDYENAIGYEKENIEKLKDLYNVSAKVIKNEGIKKGKVDVEIKKKYTDFLEEK